MLLGRKSFTFLIFHTTGSGEILPESLLPGLREQGLTSGKGFFFFFWALLIKTEFNYFLSIWLEKLPKGNY